MSKHSIALAVAALSALAVPALAGTPEPGFTDTAYVTGLSAPTAVAFLPDGRMLVTEKGGALKLRDTGGSVSTLVTIPVCTGSEMGLLGVVPDPAFASNGFIYLYRSAAADCGPASGRFNQVVRVTMSGGTVSLGSLTVLLSGINTDNGNHDGGVLRIGPDGKLYVGAGDSGLGDNQGGPGSSTNPYSQDLGSLNGKILRLELDGTAPTDNPFVGVPGARPEIFAYGFRNPFRFTFDPMSGGLWLGDVGDETVEEIDIVTAGGNYAWPHCEATLPSGCEQPGDIDPIFSYPHGGAGALGSCLIGGSFAGAAFGAHAGEYVFGDCTSNAVYRATLTPSRDDITGTPVLLATSTGTPSDFVTGPDGAVYYVAFFGAAVRRLAQSTTGIDTLVAGLALALRTNPKNPAGKSIGVVGVDPAITLGGGNGSLDDPMVGGGSLRVMSAAGFDDTYPLPASGWTPIGAPGAGRGYRYKDRYLANGPIIAVTVSNGRFLSASGRGIGLGHVLATDPNPVSVVLTTGTKRYCMSFDGTTRFAVGRQYSAKLSAAPGACPP
jgi:glucose/arabinose dehydrogenase